MFLARTALPRLALLLAVGALATAGCATAAVSPAATSTPVTSPLPAGPTVQAPIVDLAFQPAELAITAGTTVIWTNNGQEPHTVTSSDGSFQTEGNLKSGGVYQHAFAAPGTYAYICAIHSTMKGTIVVTP